MEMRLEEINFKGFLSIELARMLTDGENRFNTNPIIHTVMSQLSLGAHPINIIDDLIKLITNLQEQQTKTLESLPIRYIVDIKDPLAKDIILKKAIQTYGIENQLGMVHEEMGEILQGINKLIRGGGLNKEGNKFNKPTKESTVKYALTYWGLCSEVADKKIMLNQLELMLDKEAIKISTERKLEKLNNNLTKSNKPV